MTERRSQQSEGVGRIEKFKKKIIKREKGRKGSGAVTRASRDLRFAYITTGLSFFISISLSLSLSDSVCFSSSYFAIAIFFLSGQLSVCLRVKFKKKKKIVVVRFLLGLYIFLSLPLRTEVISQNKKRRFEKKKRKMRKKGRTVLVRACPPFRLQRCLPNVKLFLHLLHDYYCCSFFSLLLLI